MIENSPGAWSARADAKTSHEAALWSADGQRVRLAAVAAALAPRAGDTLLDYGCGTGALLDYLPMGIAYTGYDWAPGMIRRARRDHPRVMFTTAEPLTRRAGYDVIACVGVFNLADNWSRERTWDVIGRLWSRCQRSLAVSLYAGDDPSCLTYSDAEALAFAEQIGARGTTSQPRRNDVLLVLENVSEST